MYKELSETWDALIAAGSPFEITEVEVRGNPIRDLCRRAADPARRLAPVRPVR